MIRFGLPLLFSLLLVVPAIALGLFWGARQRTAAERRFAGAGLTLLRSGIVSHGRRRLKAGLILAAAALLALSIARPQIGQRSVVLPRQGSDVVIAMDVSNSMAVTDVRPSRLDRAKAAADAIVDHLGGDRVGLVTFAGSSNPRFPLTTDTEAARQVIDGLAIKDGGLKSGTDISGALATARGIFAGDKTRGKVIVLISDGEDLTSDDLAAARDAADAGLVLDTVGAGTAEGGQVIVTDPRSGRSSPIVDPSTGQTAVSHRDDANLRRLSNAGQGTAYDGNTTDFAFDLSGAVDRLEKTRFTSGATTIPIERFQIPLTLALIMLVAETLFDEMPPRRRKRRSSTVPAGVTDQISNPSAGVG